MKTIIKFLGILLALAGVWLLVQPEGIYGFMENNLESTWLYVVAIVFRLGVGIMLVMIAKDSRFPNIIKIFGYLAIIAAVVFLFIGQGRFQGFISYLITSYKSLSPVSGLMAIAIGGFLIYAFSGNKT